MSRLSGLPSHTPIAPAHEWKQIPFDEAASIAEGQVDPQHEPYASMVHVGPENIESGTSILKNCATAKSLGLISGKYLFRPGDIIYSKIRPYLRKAALVHTDGICSADMYPLTAKAGFDPTFLLAVLLSEPFTQQVVSQQDRTGIPKVNRDQLRRVLVPCPPIEVQRSIGDFFLLLSNLITGQDALLARFSNLKKALAQHLFANGLTGQGRVAAVAAPPRHWEACPLGENLLIAQYGLSVRGQQTGTYPILRMNCQRAGRVVFDELQYVDLDQATYAAYKLEDGDLLFNRTNSYELVGRTALYAGQREAVFASYLVRLRVKPSTLVPSFLNHFLNLDSTQAALKAFATKGVSQSNISASKLKTLQVPRPPIDEQRAIAELLDSLDYRIENMRSRRAALQALLLTVNNNLVTGQVHPPALHFHEVTNAS